MVFGIKNGKRVIAGAKKFAGGVKKSYVEYKANAPKRRKEVLAKLEHKTKVITQQSEIAEKKAKLRELRLKAYGSPVEYSDPFKLTAYGSVGTIRSDMPRSDMSLEKPMDIGWARPQASAFARPQQNKYKKMSRKQKKKMRKMGGLKPVDVDNYLRKQIIG